MVNEPEYANRVTPQELELCGRCKRGLLRYFDEKEERPWCYTCGSTQPGIRYQRVMEVAESIHTKEPLPSDG